MLIHIQHGKGGRDRYVPLSATLLATLREHWRWMKPKTWLFPGHDPQLAGRQADHAEGRVGRLPERRPTGRVLRSACRHTRCGIVTRRTSWKPGPTCARSSSCSATSKLEHTVIYLHLIASGICRRSLNPMDAMPVSGTGHGAPHRAGCTSGDAATLRGGRHRAPTWRSLPGDAPRRG